MSHARHAYGPLVRALREARQLTLTELAAASGRTAGYLSRIEREQGKVASWETTIRLAEALGVVPGQLTGQLPPYRPLRYLLGQDSAEEFADSIGLSPDELSDIEIGAVPARPEIVARIAGRLGVSPTVLTRPAERSGHG